LSRRAIGQLLPAAETGHYKAQMALAHVYLAGKQPDDAKQAHHWLSKAAAGGEGEALLALACAIKSGIGCPKDPAKAVALLQQAADLQHIQDAAAVLGSVLLTGDGVPRNLTRGIAYLKGAANAGSPLAAWKLALCLKNGLGALRDTKEAEKWFDKAAEGKFDQGPPWQSTVPQLQFSEVIQTFQTLASIEHRQAHYWLGICYEQGVGVPRDLKKALELYTKSGNKGFQPAVDAANRVKQQKMSVV
jgi:TPR repeat protein